MTINEFKQNKPDGVRVYVSHRRPIDAPFMKAEDGLYTRSQLDELATELGLVDEKDEPIVDGSWFQPNGGECRVSIVQMGEAGQGVVLAEGVSRCSPRDPYNKKLGRMIAFGRAMKQYEALR